MIVPGPSSPPIASMAMRIKKSCQLPATSFQLIVTVAAAALSQSEWTEREAESGNVVAELCFVDWTNLAAFVIATVRADLVRRLGLPALRTGANRHRVKGIMGAPLRGAGLGMAAFGIRHD